MMEDQARRWGSLFGGLVLIGLGVLFLVGQLLGTDVSRWLGPIVVLAIGLGFFAGMVAAGRQAGGLAIPGAMFTILGLELLYVTAFNHGLFMSYGFALFAPGGVGVGLFIFSWWSQKPELLIPARILMLIGAVLFLVFGTFFELIASLTGTLSPGRFLWPVMLILIGLLLLFGRSVWYFIFPRR
jgi:hypothetical protein